MSKREPGFYDRSSPEELRLFDGGEDDVDEEGSRLPLLLVLALLMVFAFGGVVWLAYTQGVQRGREGAPMVITAQQGPERTAPANPGGATPYQGLKIYDQRAPSDDEAAVPAHPAALSPSLRQAAEPAKAAAAVKTAAEEASAPPAELTKPKPVATLKAQPKGAGMGDAAKPAETTHSEAAAAPAKVAKVAKAAVAGGAFVLQIGAYKSEADANAAWKVYSHKHKMVAGFSPDIVKVDLGAKGTWYRLRTGSYADKAAAADACVKLKADGAACFPAKD